MKALIKWLQSMESLASTLYSEAAGCPGRDQEFAGFLKVLSEDENLHFHLLGSALNLFTETGAFPAPDIIVDRATQDRIEEPLRTALARIRAGNCGREQLLASLTQAEFSEWNHIFLYVLSTCSEHFKEFQKISALIQAHEERIKTFLSNTPGGEEQLTRLRELPVIWKRRFLVVEDQEELREIFCHVLALDGESVPAANGRIALDLTREQHFDAIISDIKMPEMNGHEFFRQALENDPDLKGRLLFVTGGSDDEAVSFAREHAIPLLRKPFDLNELRRAANGIVHSLAPSGKTFESQ